MRRLKYYLIIFQLCSALCCMAQNWCPSGAGWNYYIIDSAYRGYISYRYDQDDTIDNIRCKVIHAVSYGQNYTNYTHDTYYGPIDTVFLPSLYTYASGDTIYFNVNGHFRPYYYFNAKIGDTLRIAISNYSYQDTDYLAVVDSNGITWNLMDKPFHYYDFHLVDTTLLGSHENRVIKWIGSYDFNTLIPSWTYPYQITGPHPLFLDCYSDDSLNANANLPNSCNYAYDFLGINDFEYRPVIKIYPNPVQDFLLLDYSLTNNGEEKQLNVKVINILGQALTTAIPLSFGEQKIDMKQFPPGLYFTLITKNEQIVAIQKFVKE